MSGNEEPETIPTASTPKITKTSKKKKTSDKPEWKPYIWHLTDQRRTKLMELPVIPDSVKQTNKYLLVKKKKSDKDMDSKKLKSENNETTTTTTKTTTTKKLLKSIIKSPNSINSSSSVSRTKSYTSDEDLNDKKTTKSSPNKPILKRTESRNTNSSDSDEDTSKSSNVKNLSRRKIQFRSIRGNRDHSDSRDFEAKYNSINYGFNQMQVSSGYNKLLRSMRSNLDHYNRCRQNKNKFLEEYSDILDPPLRRIIVTAKACRRNNFMNHFYDGDTMCGAPLQNSHFA